MFKQKVESISFLFGGNLSGIVVSFASFGPITRSAFGGSHGAAIRSCLNARRFFWKGLSTCQAETFFFFFKCIFHFSYFSPNSLLWGSLLGKERLAAICSGHVPGACPPCVRLVSATCLPCWLWPRLHSLSVTCPPSVRALCCLLWTRLQSLSAACPPCVHHLPALCPPSVVGFGRAPSPCPPLVRLVSALCCFGRASTPCPPLVRYLSAACPPLVRHLSVLCLPCVQCVVGFGRASRPCPPLVRFVSATCPPCVVGFGRAFSPCPPLVRLVSATCPPYVRLVFLALAPPPVLVGHLSARCLPIMSAFIVSGSASLYVHLCPGLFVCRFRRSRFLKRHEVMHWPTFFPKLKFTVGFPLSSHVTTLCPPRVRRVSAWLQMRLLCLPCVCPPSGRFVSSGPPCALAWTLTARGLLWDRAVASWSIKFFLSTAQIACILAPKFSLCKHALCLKNCLGSMLDFPSVFQIFPQTVR